MINYILSQIFNVEMAMGGGALFIFVNYKEFVAGFYRCIYVIVYFKIRILFTVSPSTQ